MIDTVPYRQRMVQRQNQFTEVTMDIKTQNIADQKVKPHPVTVQVNGHPVAFPDRKATGLEIKQAAIAQGVAIQLDFHLYWVNPGEHLKLIPDSETVELNENKEFRAVTPDENS